MILSAFVCLFAKYRQKHYRQILMKFSGIDDNGTYSKKKNGDLDQHMDPVTFQSFFLLLTSYVLGVL